MTVWHKVLFQWYLEMHSTEINFPQQEFGLAYFLQLLSDQK